jgi:hypothetical protein
MEGADDIGAVVTGALAARALEPGAGEAGAEGGAACLNCGTPVLRRYCPECGQAAHVHRTLGAFWHDIAHSVLHFEGKIWRTLPLLAWRPGELTRRYVEGERAGFVSPMALFLFSVFLMFAVISTLGGSISVPGEEDPKVAAEAREETRREFERERAESAAKVEALAKSAPAWRRPGNPRPRPTRKSAPRSGRLPSRNDFSRRRCGSAERTRELQTNKRKAEPSRFPDRQRRRRSRQTRTIWSLSRAPRGSTSVQRRLQKGQEEPVSADLQDSGQRPTNSHGADPDQRAVRLAAVPAPPRYRQYKVYDHTVFVTYSMRS